MATLTTLFSFNGADGDSPLGPLIADANGDLFGTTSGGGTGVATFAGAGGTVFEIVKTTSGYASVQTLADFNGANGSDPVAGLTIDANGDLFGTTEGGGAVGNYGTVFEIAMTASGYGSVQTLISLNPTNGAYPNSTLTADANGDLFGTTEFGGPVYAGAVFEIAKTENGYASLQTIAAFNETNGADPYAGLIADSNGDLFGTTEAGGTNSVGTVFEITKTESGYGGIQTLATFDTENGSNPSAGLIADTNGDLFGTTEEGGANGLGTVFEITKTASGYSSVQTLATFNSANGSNPTAGLIADANGDLFGTTLYGGADGDGTVFEISKTTSGYTSVQTLISFNYTDGSGPQGGVIADANGDLFGTTGYGGAHGLGTTFEVTDSGFVPMCYLRGTHILTLAGEVRVEDLEVGDLVMTRFGALQPIKWIGRRSYDRRFVQFNSDQIPVRIRPGALGERSPMRDLYVSPGHSMLIEDQLILAKYLINGVTITQDEASETISYLHIELETHDCVVAEGAWSETFAEGDQLRSTFQNAEGFRALYPDHGLQDDFRLCAPRPMEGPALEAALRRVLAQMPKAITPGPLRGFIDQATAKTGGIAGWAQDLDYPEAPVDLEIVYEGRVIGSVLACDFRDDLTAAKIGGCGFRFTPSVPLDPKLLHTLRARRASDGFEIPPTDACSKSWTQQALRPTEARGQWLSLAVGGQALRD